MQAKFKSNDKINFVSISIDRDIKAWQNFILSDSQWKGLHLHQNEDESSKMWDDYRMFGVPTYIVIDKEGNIVDVKAPRPSDPKSGELLASLTNSID